MLDAGFDTASAILNISTDDIKEIEDYISDNLDILKGSCYDCGRDSGHKHFKLKPGHKSFILNLPKVMQTKKRRRNDEHSEIAGNDVVSTNQMNDTANNANDDEAKKEALITKLLNYSKERSLPITFDTSHIFDFIRNNDEIRCKILCTICNLKSTITYRRYWRASNFQAHLKGHFSAIETADLDELGDSDTEKCHKRPRQYNIS